MWSPGTRLSNMNGPTQTGLAPKSSPAFASCVGERTHGLPWNAASFALRWKTTVYGPAASTLLTESKSLRRDDLGWLISRSTEVTTACALNGVLSLNLTSVRSLTE